ncbi:alpha-1,6-mannosyl-glycoprotein 2-beta-N-acetylglucosaminyltransferase-like [Latimeria chalumnae]|uniref:Si:ch73-91k6.2 n=1 Tax=Latimeria chalumnae TaxID=7897 RepID=H3AA66_LATCH|nr:PREDICTED: alpha-1,6-mannosyl-glycoprotein 2-beta-N-acetylglucosaminyltransferase-like [Latimeria chalumnae]|eukprot:XP_006010752.1 PREDICTED: alpha-1,6-mannosyl-glycoprotein 2-beta-N-acetylglucosaminyltransferase-like [Latimeria chalumnae]
MRFRVHKKKVFAATVTGFVASFLLYNVLRVRSEDGAALTPGLQGRDSAGESQIPGGRTQNAAPFSGSNSSKSSQQSRKRPTIQLPSGDLAELKRAVYENNFRQPVLNVERFPEEPDWILVIQAHNRVPYLLLLLESLRQVAGIDTALLVFSLDYVSDELLGVVQGVDFCRVLVIVFPYSTQMYPEDFPGQDPRDCPRDISRADALQSGCHNALHPDMYGHYREAAFTQPKHHWWWKLHFVWERLQPLRGYSGYVLFLEEDNYVLPDLYHVLKLMARLQKEECPNCEILALGNHDGSLQYQERGGVVDLLGWTSTKHNIGMAMSRALYYKLMSCAAEFCSYDDYNWDWTLQHLSARCLSRPLRVMVARGSRVLHSGDCGMHRPGGCKPEETSQKMQAVLESSKAHLFPETLAIGTKEDAISSPPRIKNGGWGDVRDHALCRSYAKL